MSMTPNVIIPISATSLVVCAPHVDDEVIGCYTALVEANYKKLDVHIIYFFETDEKRKAEALAACVRFKATPHFLKDSGDDISEWWKGILKKVGTAAHFLVPTRFDQHPDHKYVNRFVFGQLMKYSYPATIGFYSVDMSVPGTQPLVIKHRDDKKAVLYELYPSQHAYFESNAKCYLFEDIRPEDIWIKREFLYTPQVVGNPQFLVSLARVGKITKNDLRNTIQALESIVHPVLPSLEKMLYYIGAQDPATDIEYSIYRDSDRTTISTPGFPG